MTSADEATDPRYQAALRELSGRGRFGIRLGLTRVRALLARLGDPQAGLPGVLIGGTNGKGSVQALVAAALRAAGYRVGQTPKPHLSSYRERLVVDGRRIGIGDFSALLEEVLAETHIVARRHSPPTEFEVLTAAAFSWFRRQRVDLAVVEVGMGGRLDATNAWQGGLSAITNVALDHMEYLGPTVAAIAREKARIIKRGDALALTGAEGEALGVIRRRARRTGVPLGVVEPLPVLAMDRRGLVLDAGGGQALRVGLLGRHQSANAALAQAIIAGMAEVGMADVAPGIVGDAFAAARWPGRLELLTLGTDGRARPVDDASAAPDAHRPDVVLDGAHNPHGAQALAAALDELRPQLSVGPATLLVGLLRDKDVAGMLTPLAASAALDGAAVITTDVPDSPRALPAVDLAAAWRSAAGRGMPPRAIADATDALSAAVDAALSRRGPLVVCGSLYLVGHVRDHLVEEELNTS
jgi:dihydrofolate synthase / folylpolyglutamate synthase